MHNLAIMYDNGIGVKRNPEKAMKWFEKIRKTSHHSLVPEERRIDSESIAAYQKLAEIGTSRALFYLGTMYEEGAGVKQDKQKAAKLYFKAARGGYVYPQRRLDKMITDEPSLESYVDDLDNLIILTEWMNKYGPRRSGYWAEAVLGVVHEGACTSNLELDIRRRTPERNVSENQEIDRYYFLFNSVKETYLEKCPEAQSLTINSKYIPVNHQCEHKSGCSFSASANQNWNVDHNFIDSVKIANLASETKKETAILTEEKGNIFEDAATAVIGVATVACMLDADQCGLKSNSTPKPSTNKGNIISPNGFYTVSKTGISEIHVENHDSLRDRYKIYMTAVYNIGSNFSHGEKTTRGYWYPDTQQSYTSSYGKLIAGSSHCNQWLSSSWSSSVELTTKFDLEGNVWESTNNYPPNRKSDNPLAGCKHVQVNNDTCQITCNNNYPREERGASYIVDNYKSANELDKILNK